MEPSLRPFLGKIDSLPQLFPHSPPMQVTNGGKCPPPHRAQRSNLRRSDKSPVLLPPCPHFFQRVLGILAAKPCSRLKVLNRQSPVAKLAVTGTPAKI